MNYVIISAKADGVLSIIRPTKDILNTHTMEQVLNKYCPPESFIADLSLIPTSRKWRDCWKWVPSKGIVDIDIVAAKDLAHKKRRDLRDSLFAAHDVLVTVPHLAEKAEEIRVLIRKDDAENQIKIDLAVTVQDLDKIID